MTEGEVEVAFARLDPKAATRDRAGWLSEDELDRARRFVFERDRRRYVAGRTQLREMLGARLQVAPRAVAFAYGPRGKPRLADRFASSGWRFNVSHCEDVAIFAFARNREVGVDIEAVRALPDADEVAARCFSPGESAAYRALAAHDRPLGFFNCWTRKEAFIKALGDGLYFPLEDFDVSLVPGEPARILKVSGGPGETCGWTLREVALPTLPRHVAAVAVRCRAGRS
jgi:4'-phosphopantetheinyl transferase